MFWLLVLIVVLVTVYCLRGEDLSSFDFPRGQSFATGEGPNEEHKAVEELLKSGLGSVRADSMRERLSNLRQYMDSMSDIQSIEADITPVVVAGLDGEWVLAPGADPNRRVLYIHGGAFMVGSPKSHRNITSKFSQVAKAAVLAIDYRLMPENSRKEGIEDCQAAYRWIINNGPQGPAAADKVFIGGDSAGGNLTLSLTAWLRSQPLKQPEAAVAMSPLTDSTLSSPTWKSNVSTDAMLGPALGKLTKVPKPLLWWVSLLQSRISPSNPVISPVFGDLSGLPPTLVQASEAEMLLGDARRYVNRAAAAGSPVKLQTWPHVVHVWQLFHPDLSEARAAWDEIEKFVAAVDAGNFQIDGSDDDDSEKVAA
jgi:epsilon-lactone hydrolase